MELETVKRASLNSTLSLGKVEAEVKLYKTTGKGEKSPSFVTAGPNGHPLRAEKRATEAGADETEGGGDPFGIGEDGAEDPTVVPAATPTEDPGPEAPPTVASGVESSAPGKFKTVMVEEETGEVVEPDDVRRGVRDPGGRFVDLTDQLKAIDEKTKLEQIQVLDFIRRERLPRERVVGSYYLAAAASGDTPRILRLIFEGMKRTERVAIIRWTKVKGQSLGFLVPHASGALVVLEVAFADEARKPNSACLAHMRAEVKEKHVESVVGLISSLSAPPSTLDEYVNRRDELQRELIEAAEETGDVSAFETVEEAGEGVDKLDELLVAAVRS